MYWQCLHRNQCRPKCKSRLTTLDQNVIREQPHCHGPEIRDVHRAHVISRLKSDRSHQSPGDIVRVELLAAAVDVKMALPNPLNLRQRILRACRKDLGPQPPPATSARAYVIADTSTGAPVTPTDPPVLFLLFDDVSSTGKIILFWMSSTFLALRPPPSSSLRPGSS